MPIKIAVVILAAGTDSHSGISLQRASMGRKMPQIDRPSGGCQLKAMRRHKPTGK